MTPRRRSSRKTGWPQNLYEEHGYFYWRHPVTRAKVGIGRVSKAMAFDQAVEANLYVSGQAKQQRVIDRIREGGERTVKGWAEKFEKIIAKRGLSKNTLIMYRSWLRRFRNEFGDNTRLADIKPVQVADKLEAIEARTPTTAKQLRGLWHDIFLEAELAGWIERNHNPVMDTRTRRVGVKRARLTFPMFMRVYRAARLSWLPKAMALALVSGQRRETVVPARFADIREDGWRVDQGKTGAKIIIPLELRLAEFEMSLGEVIKMCRSTGVLSPYVIHQTERHGMSRPGDRLKLRRITGAFTDEITRLGIDWEGKTPPTFHEIRSLAKRMYKAQGNVDTKALLGHKSDSSAKLYEDSRGAEWVRVQVGSR